MMPVVQIISFHIKQRQVTMEWGIGERERERENERSRSR
jgi:hypothetical protein